MREINLQEWVQRGEGGTALSYFHKVDKTIMLKLFKKERSFKEIEDEFLMGKKIETVGLKTCKTIDLVKAGDLYGIIYERLQNKVSISRLCADSPDNLELFAKIYANEAKQVHKLKCDDSFESMKNKVIKTVLQGEVTFKKDEENIIKFINSFEDTKTAIHGDLHTGNLLQVVDQYYWIDLGDFSYGNPWFDIGTLYLVCNVVSNTRRIQNNVHMNAKQLSRFWIAFDQEYFGDNKAEERREIANIFALLRLIQRVVYGNKTKFEKFLCKIIYGSKLGKAVRLYFDKK